MPPQGAAVTSEIYQVGGYGLTASEDAAIYLIQFNEHAVLIDSGDGRWLMYRYCYNSCVPLAEER